MHAAIAEKFPGTATGLTLVGPAIRLFPGSPCPDLALVRKVASRRDDRAFILPRRGELLSNWGQNVRNNLLCNRVQNIGGIQIVTLEHHDEDECGVWQPRHALSTHVCCAGNLADNRRDLIRAQLVVFMVESSGVRSSVPSTYVSKRG